MKPLLTEQDVVRLLRLGNVRQLRRLCLEKGLPVLIINTKIRRHDEDELRAWLDSKAVNSVKPRFINPGKTIESLTN